MFQNNYGSNHYVSRFIIFTASFKHFQKSSSQIQPLESSSKYLRMLVSSSYVFFLTFSFTISYLRVFYTQSVLSITLVFVYAIYNTLHIIMMQMSCCKDLKRKNNDKYLQKQNELQDIIIFILNMNIDFLLFKGPKVKYSFVDFWGQVIFIPANTQKVHNLSSNKSILDSLANCYHANKNKQVYFSVDAALSDHKGQQLIQELEGTTTNSNQQQIDQQTFSHFIPCLFLNSMVQSKYIILYFHASGEDIKICHGLLNFIRNSYQINVISMEYPGYSIYKGSSDSQTINNNANIVYNYIVKNLGFKQENIIIIGRSIGSGVALELLNKKKRNNEINPRCLALISPFLSVKNLAKEFIGKLGTYLTKQNFNNSENIKEIKCPVFIVHGIKDALISHEQSKELIENCSNRKKLILPENMTHSSFDFYSDLVDPLRQFLIEEGVNFYEQKMEGPTVSDELFKCPEGFKF